MSREVVLRVADREGTVNIFGHWRLYAGATMATESVGLASISVAPLAMPVPARLLIGC